MGTMNFSIPDDLKERFNAVFKDANKSAIVAQLMERAIDDEERRRRKGSFVERSREIRSMSSRGYSDEEIRKIRDELRK